jgi:protein SCO1/2
MRLGTNRTRRRMKALIGAAVLLAASVSLAACGVTHKTTVGAPAAAKTAAPSTALRGLIPQPLPQKPSFTLTDTAGRPFHFSARTQGKLAYLYFGYTHCPDACPLAMGDISSALRHVPPALRRRVEVVFVTVDPRRDTPGVLRAWLNHFGTSFVGLRGSEREIQAAERSAGVPVAPAQKPKGGRYAVQHSSLVLPYSPDNRAHVVYLQGSRASDYAHDLPLLLKY